MPPQVVEPARELEHVFGGHLPQHLVLDAVDQLHDEPVVFRRERELEVRLEALNGLVHLRERLFELFVARGLARLFDPRAHVGRGLARRLDLLRGRRHKTIGAEPYVLPRSEGGVVRGRGW